MARTIFEKADVVPLVAEVFRELGYEGASMSSITARTKLSKGSIYHFFPGGKEAMAGEILAHVDAWFVRHVFEPLERNEPRAAIASMWKSVDVYFRSGRRICLVGAFALDEARDLFAGQIREYFEALDRGTVGCADPGRHGRHACNAARGRVRGWYSGRTYACSRVR